MPYNSFWDIFYKITQKSLQVDLTGLHRDERGLRHKARQNWPLLVFIFTE